MAIPDPEVREILTTLAESDLSVLAVVGWDSIAELQMLDDGDASAQRIHALEQLDVLSHALLVPLQREAEALAWLPQLASELGLEPSVQIIEDDDRGTRTVELVDPLRRYLLDRFLAALDQSIGAARERILARRETEL